MLRLPEARVAKEEEEEKVATREVVVAVAAAVAEERVTTDNLVRTEAHVRTEDLVKVAIELNVMVVIADPALRVATADLTLRAATADLALRAATADLRETEEDSTTSEVASEVEEAVLNLSLTLKAESMSDLLAVKVKFSVETVVDSAAREEKAVSVAAVVDSVAREETTSEVAAVAPEADNPDLSMATTPREVVAREEVAPALPEVVPPLLD